MMVIRTDASAAATWSMTNKLANGYFHLPHIERLQ